MINFDDIVNGKIKNPTAEQVQEAINETVTSAATLKDINDFLVKMHASDAYKIIRDVVQPKTNLIVRRAKENEPEEYQRFQNIQQEAKNIFDYERKTATIFDVQQISSGISQQFYGIAVKMISTLDDELGKVEKALNTIEEHIGLSVTQFDKEDINNDTTKSGNEQGSKEVTE